MSTPTGIAVTRQAAVAQITIDRPARRNALHGPAWRALGDALDALAAGGDVRCAIIAGAGGHFCAGDDLKESELKLGGAPARAYALLIERVYARLREAPFPVIAAIDGACVGGGLSVALHCDFRIAARDAKFSVPVARIGDYYPLALCARLARIVGAQAAARILMVGDPLDGEAADCAGLASLSDDPMAEALAMAHRLAAGAPLVLHAMKRAVNAVLDGKLDDEAAEIDAMIEAIKISEDRNEGRLAFLEKRPPRFRGR